MNELTLPLETQEWYQALIDDCKSIIVERMYTSRLEEVICKGEIGQRIVEDENYKKYGKGNRDFNRRLFVDLGIGERNGYYCLQFYERVLQNPIKEEVYKDVCTAVQSIYPKNLTWSSIRAELPESPNNKVELSLPKGKYQVIYADPPWKYDREVGQGVAIDQYQTLALEEIKNIPVSSLSTEDSILFMWATFPKLVEALEVIKSWGFEYKTVAFTWVKTNKNNDKPFFGIGSYFKSNAEVCLLATKGEPHPLVKDNSLSSIIISPLEEHSRKPAEARKRIEKLLGEVSKLELFSREKVDGWDSWGNDVARF